MNTIRENEFEKYYKKYYYQVYGYILKKISDEKAAEDLTMDVFCSCWSKFEIFDENKASFQTWLYVVVNNKLKNFYRDRKELFEFDDSIISDSDHEDDVLSAIQLQFLQDHLYISLQNLNEIQRKIIVLKFFKNMNASEIASHTGLSSGNIRVMLKRSLDKIRKYFNDNDIRWE